METLENSTTIMFKLLKKNLMWLENRYILIYYNGYFNLYFFLKYLYGLFGLKVIGKIFNKKHFLSK